MRLVSLDEEILGELKGFFKDLYPGQARPLGYQDLLDYARKGGDTDKLSHSILRVFDVLNDRIRDLIIDINYQSYQSNPSDDLQRELFDYLRAACFLAQVASFADKTRGTLDKDTSLTAEALLTGGDNDKSGSLGAVVLDALTEYAKHRSPSATYASKWAHLYADLYGSMAYINGLDGLAKPHHVEEAIKAAGESNFLLLSCAIAAARANGGIPDGFVPSKAAVLAVPVADGFLYARSAGERILYFVDTVHQPDTIAGLTYEINKKLNSPLVVERNEGFRLLLGAEEILHAGLLDPEDVWRGAGEDRQVFDDFINKAVSLRPSLKEEFGPLMPERIRDLLGIKLQKSTEPLFEGWRRHKGIIFVPSEATYVDEDPPELSEAERDHFAKFGQAALNRWYDRREPVTVEKPYVYKKPGKDSEKPAPG